MTTKLLPLFRTVAAAVFVFAFFIPAASSPVRAEEPVSPTPDARKTQARQTVSATPAEVFDAMRKSFRADVAKGVHARYQFDISGPAGGNWWIVVNDGKFEMGEGFIDHPDVTLAASDRDWVQLSNGTLGGTRAVLTGRLKIKGSQGLARKLDVMFP